MNEDIESFSDDENPKRVVTRKPSSHNLEKREDRRLSTLLAKAGSGLAAQADALERDEKAQEQRENARKLTGKQALMAKIGFQPASSLLRKRTITEDSSVTNSKRRRVTKK